jgi:hypothetical protein
VAHIFQHMFNRLARRGLSEEWLCRERVREGGNRRMAEEQARREQERRVRSEELLRGLPPVQSLGPKVGWERSTRATTHRRLSDRRGYSGAQSSCELACVVV